MADLISAGVDVRVIDESFYASAGQGTVPLIIIGTHANKANPSGQGIAEGTLTQNANKVYLITSQRELIQTFGTPVFYAPGGKSLHGYELNEYGLHAAYQYLSIANRAFVIRAGIDFNQLRPVSSPPRGEPINGTYWLDLQNTAFGVFESNGGAVPGTAWNDRTPLVVNSQSQFDQVVLGTRGIANPASGGFATVNGVLVINNIAVNIVAGDTMDTVASKITTSGIPGVNAIAFRLGEQSYLMIRNTLVGTDLDIGNASTAQLLIDFGLTSPGDVVDVPKVTVGVDGSFAVITTSSDNQLYQKLKPEGVVTSNDPLSTSFWFRVGSPEWKRATPTRVIGSSTPTQVPSAQVLTISTNNVDWVTVNVAADATVSQIVSAINAEIDSLPENHTAKSIVAGEQGTAIVIADSAGGDIYLNSPGSILSALGLISMPAYTKGNRVFYASHVNIPTGSMKGDVWIKTTSYNKGASWVIKLYSAATSAWDPIAAPMYANDAEATNGFGGTMAIGTLYVRYNLTGTGLNPSANHQIRRWNGTFWDPLVYEADVTAPTTEAPEGTLWYNTRQRVDIMINKDGQRWIGYKNYPGLNGVDPNGPILAGSAPIYQSTGAPLVNGDLWIDTSDLENYPKIHRWDSVTRRWIRIDNTDQHTPFGIYFADARANADGSANGPTDATSMLSSDFVDPDCPDPRQFPDGVLLFNTRYSTYNVKQWQPYYFNDFEGTDYTLQGYSVGAYNHTAPLLSAGRWVTVSRNDSGDGSPLMGRKAQRDVIVRSLQETITANEDISSETLFFNLIACPGYIEAIDEMVTLNAKKKQIAFVVGDTPARLKPDGTSVRNWATPELTGNQTNSEKGIATYDPYVGVWYPWGLSTNIDGSEVMVPPSTIALYTLAYNDSVSYVWSAPAGYTRGLVGNATTVGYLTDEGEFKAVMLNQGQRDTLYENRINPIAYMQNRGLVVWGQKTRHNQTTALDRINVARLVNYLKWKLDEIARPFLFEPNNKHTRDAALAQFQRFLGGLVTQNALYDYVVVCDETNNTPDRIDQNQLWIDIAIKPMKAVEFIIIPLRLVNSSTDLQTYYSRQ